LLQQQLPNSGAQEHSLVPSQAHSLFTQLHLGFSHAIRLI